MPTTPDIPPGNPEQASRSWLTTPVAFLLAAGIVAVAVVVAAVVIRSGGGSDDSAAYKFGYSAGHQLRQDSTLSDDLSVKLFCSPGNYSLAAKRTATPAEKQDYATGCKNGFNDEQPDLNDAKRGNVESNVSPQAADCTSDIMDYAAMIPGWVEAGAQDITPSELLQNWGGDSAAADIAADVAGQVSNAAATSGDVDALLGELQPQVESRCSAAY